MTDLRATRISPTGGQAVTVVSRKRAVTDWALRYFGSWWSATTVDPAEVNGPVVAADVDPDQVERMTAHVTSAGRVAETEFAGALLLHRVDEDGVVAAAQPDSGLAHQWNPHTSRMVIAGHDEITVATAAARLAREVVRGRLLADGWQILHASAVTRPDGATVLALGDKGAGKTTVGFLLARAGWRLLANDRIFVRVLDGTIRILPWPSAAAIGFGFLDALGLYEPVRRRLLDGEPMHPTQHRRVTDALVAGDRTPLWRASGKELKPQFFPDQLTTWLGMELAVEGHAAGILFPRIQPGAGPALSGTTRGVQDRDFFSAATEDRYPDVFGLLPLTGPTPELTRALAALPHQALVLGHDTAAATALLEKTADRLL
ncbi:hypothetical protein OG599_14235 [Streptomyces sp. NBC_01335]|uniref:hypothetical protein n=1 Tax=Streptomyces sp. NBC_01335 TaxID=2903828 RepID=UPI002E0D7DC7|nr:hypothetical protein OG599_14235 [Streptomyces sp. NBC_01335]